MSDRFAPNLIRWHKKHGRHNLPWQNTRDPYRIWLSEIMLQQTQVNTVIPYYERFLKRFPDIQTLARAREDSVLALWSGLGYYSRARNLHKAAKAVRQGFPKTLEEINALPGIGKSTAAAITVFAYGQKNAILDGNVKRVLARVFGIKGFPGDAAVEQAMWDKANALLPAKDIRIYTQALMDLGATLCTRTHPDCPVCPQKKICYALKENKIHDLPGKKKRPPLPKRKTIMAVYRDREKILLIKRPAKGVWAGLWSFPEVKKASGVKLPVIKHTFTHFHLSIQPVLIKKGNGRKGEWVTVSRARKMGLPVPVRKILEALP